MSQLPLGGRRPVPEGWTLCVLDDVKSPEPNSCRAGPFGSSISQRYFVPEGVPVIRGNNLTVDLTPFLGEDFVFVSEQRAREQYKACLVTAGDLVFTCWGSIGQVGRVPESGPYSEYVISNKQLKLRVDPARVDSRFLYYYLASSEGVEYLKSRAIGSAVPGINLGILRSIPVAMPRLDTQQRIVRVLGAYDDLIAANDRRMALLEESVHLLYREWFERLRFPGYEWTPVIDGVPDGWQRGCVGDLVSLVTDRLDPSEVESTVPYVGLEHIPRRSLALQEWGTAAEVTSTKLRFVAGDILFAKIRPYFHKVVVAPVDGITSSDTLVLRPTEHRSFGLAVAVAASGRFVEHSSNTGRIGTRMPRADWMTMAAYPVLLPPESLAGEFSEYVRARTELIGRLILANRKLRDARDYLLPRLMSGQLAA